MSRILSDFESGVSSGTRLLESGASRGASLLGSGARKSVSFAESGVRSGEGAFKRGYRTSKGYVSDTWANFKWCPPLVIYAVIAIAGVIGILTKKNVESVNKFKQVLVALLWAIFWSYIMYSFCDHDNVGMAWFVLLLPIVIWTLLTVLIATGMMKANGKCEWQSKNGTVCMNADNKADCDAMYGKYTAGEFCMNNLN